VADILDRILAVKAEEIARAKKTLGMAAVRRQAEAAETAGFHRRPAR